MKKLTTFLAIVISFSLNAQLIYLKHEKTRIPDLKTKTIYFVLSGKNDNDFKEVISKYWTFTKFKVITPDEIKQNLSTSNVFFPILIR
ncbi:MAG TPA: hypothetical protein VNZ49_06270 [Bacteroidia bacterium]|jgi:hypothetical protein|nr:hypothetical protein [Bacteroidia bacterium]